MTYQLVDNESAVTVCISILNEKGITINQTSKNGHVPEVERADKTLKERVRVVWNTLHDKFSNKMIIGFIY